MNVVPTRTSNNLTIFGIARRADGKVLIHFTITQVGVWQNIRFGSKVWFPGSTNGFMMTPALNDPQHAKDPLFVPGPGATFVWVWDAPLDGYGTGTLSGLRFELAYVNVFCCEEMEQDPGVTIPTPPRPPPVPPPPPPPPPPGIPIPVPTPYAPGGPLPPTVLNPQPDAGSQDPTYEPPVKEPEPRPTPTYPYDPRWFQEFTVAPQFPLFGITDSKVALQSRTTVPLAPAPSTEPVFFDYQQWLARRLSPVPTSGGTSPQDLLYGLLDRLRQPDQGGFFGTQQTADSYQLNVTPQVLPYPTASQYTGLFSTPTSALQVIPFLPVAALPQTQKSVLFFALKNPNGSPMQGIQSMVIAKTGDGSVRLIQPAELVQATDAGGADHPPGYIPPGYSVGQSVCINWDQLPIGPALFLVVLLSQTGQPFTSGRTTGVAYPMGSMVPAPAQAVELLGPGNKQLTGFPAYMQPTYEGSVNAVGDEDTFVFTPGSGTISVVVQITEDARSSGFTPKLEIYDVDDMNTPVATSSTRLQIGGVDIEPEYHAVAWQGTLTAGQPHVVVVKNSTPHYSSRWHFRIFHVQPIPGTGGTLEVDAGSLTGQLSCAYGRQSIKLLNDRTGEAIFVRTNERGITDDIQRDTKAGTPSKLLAVAVGDKIDVIRPGPGVLYRRHGDLLAQGDVT